MTRAQPVLGFPSKKHAIAALADRGLTIKEIAARIDSTADAVRVALRQMKAPPEPTWSPERIEKAKRLIALTFDEIARAMSVPVADLQRLAADGVSHLPAAPKEEPAEPAPAMTPEADQDASEPVRSVSLAGKRLRLRAADGQYLHFSCTQMTRNRAYAWTGSHRQLQAVRRRWPETRSLRVVVVSDAKVTP